MRGERRDRVLFRVMDNREIGQKLKKDVTGKGCFSFMCIFLKLGKVRKFINWWQ